MKPLILILTLILITFIAKAQTTVNSGSNNNPSHISIGVDAGIPTGNVSHAYPKILGLSLQADLPVATSLFFTVNAGYNNMFGHTYQVAQLAGAPTFTSKNVHLLPVKAGLKFFPVNHFYIQGEAGAIFLLNKADFFDDRSVAFAYAPQIGVQFPVSVNGNFIDAGIRYESTTNYSSAITGSAVNFVGLRLAYGFN